MGLDYLAFKRIINLVASSIIDGKIVKISQLSNEEFLFVVRNGNQNHNLLISTHPNMSYLNLVTEKPESNRITSNLLMIFRKYLENGKIVSFECKNDDRVMLMDVINRDDYFRNTHHKLYIELIGRASNLILTDENDIIIDSLKKIPLEYTNIRTILPGIAYVYPTKPAGETLPYDLQNEIEKTNKTIEEITKKINESNCIYINIVAGKKKDYHFIPLTFYDGTIEKYDWNVGLDVFYGDTLQSERHRQFTSRLDKLSRLEIKKSEKKIKKLEEELAIAKDSMVYKDYGDYLLTYLQGKTITTDEVEVEDYDGNILKIPYDKTKDLYKNANNYYKKYQKSKVAILKIQEQIDLCKENIDYFETIRYQLSISDIISANQIEEELTNAGYLKKYQKPNKTTKKKEKVYKPLKFVVDDTVIYCGQNNLQNEYLTFKMANKSHMFFHIKDGPGSHVVVFSDNVSEKIKKIAALIAAYYSTYSMSSTVPVNYTKVKDIKKIPGGKIGKVIINNYKTIYVDPDYDLIKQYKVN